MDNQYSYSSPVTDSAMDIVELQSTLSDAMNINKPFLDSNFLLHETPPSTYIGLPEVPNFSSFLQGSPNVYNELEQFPTNVALQPHGRMEVGEPSRPRTVRRRLEHQVAQEREGNFKISKHVPAARSRNHCETEKKRRERIRDRIKRIKELVPDCEKSAAAEVLDAANHYISWMQYRLNIMSSGSLVQNYQMGPNYGMPVPHPLPLPMPAIPQQPAFSALPPLPALPQQPAFGALPPLPALSLPQAEAAMMAAATFQTMYTPPGMGMGMGIGMGMGMGMMIPPIQPSMVPPLQPSMVPPLQPSMQFNPFQPPEFEFGFVPPLPALPPPVAPSIVVPPNFSAFTNNEQGLNQTNPDDHHPQQL